MNSKEYSIFLQTHIKPWCVPASGGKVVKCRCFYCSDSSNIDHGHFYISIPENENDVSLFYCQKCKVGGVVTSKKLIEWDIFDSDIATALSSHNNKALSNPLNMKYNALNVYDINYNIINTDDLSKAKLKYINDRLGTNLSFSDCINLKIILNLRDLFSANKYLIRTRDERIIEYLDTAFIGFLSLDNAFLNMRKVFDEIKVHESIDKRYVNYNVFNKYDNTRRFYCIPTEIDFRYPVEIHLAEGPFDILSIYLNLRKNSRNAIFVAVGGSGYKGLLRYFISILKTPNLIIHIYPDNDQGRYIMLDIANYIKPFGYQLYIHRNNYEGEKDFGVPLNRINEIIERIN